MLESLFGNIVAEKVLFFIQAYGDGYARKMSRVYDIPLNGILQQLRRLENGGIIVGQDKGRTRLYTFNPRYPFLLELKTLLQKAMDLLPEEEIVKYYRLRTRPRRKGKPL
ncbi:MAG: ArsR family transcriptional regulator [Elusimicrobiota bacterium]